MNSKSNFWERYKYIILAILFGIIVTIYSYDGFGISNHIEHLPPILRNLDDSYLINDFFTNASVEGIARRYYALFISKLSGSEENLILLYLLLTFLTNISISLSTFYFTRYLFMNSSRSGIFASAMVLSLSTLSLAGASSFLHTTYLNPSNIAVAFILWACYFVARGNLLLGITLSGISSIFHPLLGLEMGTLLFFSYLVSLLIEHRIRVKEEWITILLSFTVFTLFSLPSIIPQFSQHSIESSLYIFIIAYFRNPHHYVPSTFNNSQYILTLAFLFTSGYIWYRERNKRDFFSSQLIAVLTVSILLLCVCGYFFVEIIPLRIMVIAQPFRLLNIVKWVGLILIAGLLTNENLKYQTRILYLISVFDPIMLFGSIVTQSLRNLFQKKKIFLNKLLQPSLVLFFVLILIKLKPDSFPNKSIILLFIFYLLIIVFNYFPKKLMQILLIIGIGASIVIGLFNSRLPYIKDSYTFNRVYSFLVSNNLPLEIQSVLGEEGNEISKFARENTPDNSVFLTPPNWGQFRLIARRAIVVDFKAFLFSDTEMLEWYKRITSCYGKPTNTGFSMIPELEANYKEISDEKLLFLKGKYDIDYAVLFSETLTDFDVIFQNNTYKIVNLSDILR